LLELDESARPEIARRGSRAYTTASGVTTTVGEITAGLSVSLTAGSALRPATSRRSWLIVQAGTAILVNHQLLTAW